MDRERTWTPAQERWQEQRRLVGVCVAAYRAVCDLQPVIAFNPDPDARSNSNRWSELSCFYKVDVSNAARRVIESKPEAERPALWTAWEALLTDDAKITPAVQKLIRALAPVFYAKRLHPSEYFRPNKHPKRKTR